MITPAKDKPLTVLNYFIRALCLALACSLSAAAVMGAPVPSRAAKPTAASQPDLFDSTNVVRIQIEISRTGISQLSSTSRGNGRARPTVMATIREGGQVYTNVAIHLKGAAGSFRPIDQNPALTLNFDKFATGQTFHGIQKLSLNNSVQDRSFLSEKISRELFEAAGVPVPRATHAKVMLNGRDLGLYVVTEGYNKQFLKRYFKNTKGNLYDGGFIRDINQSLGINSGDNLRDHSRLRELASAAKEQDSEKRWTRLQQTLDVDRFITFIAMEVLVGHWDGYTMNRNNWRAFHDLDSDKIVFMPHGMDQTFGAGGRGDSSLFPRSAQGLVAGAVLNTSEGRRRYAERMGQLATNVFKVDAVLARVDELAARIRPFIAESSVEAARRHDQVVQKFKSRIVLRGDNVARALGATTHQPRFEQGKALPLTGWKPRIQSGSMEFPEQRAPEGNPMIGITVSTGDCIGSWRTGMYLEEGKYRFSGRIRTKDLKPLTGQKDSGAELRISGGPTPPGLSGTGEWREFIYQFSVREEAMDVEFVCEIRASKGEAWFDAASLQLVRIP